MKVVHIFTRIDLGGAEIAALSALDQLNESIDFYIFSFGKVNYKLVKEQKIRFKERIFEVDFIRKPVQAARNFLKLIKLSPNIIIY